MTTALPKKVLVGPLVFDVAAVAGAKDWGLTDLQAGTITLRAGMTPEMQRWILAHEVMHAALFASGVMDDANDLTLTEEAWVARTSPLFADALQRSPGLAEFLAGAA